ncbi:unnamed protein product [Clonostachys rhizophaga]|uniref:Uncharacterized protein n=1 Tax=Clonostachys rhizophaga TaxID=160324 RepID=A0A9N9VMB3_9HYPO|nr:unnamed protein product [Clonostachys rhizophaga]
MLDPPSGQDSDSDTPDKQHDSGTKSASDDSSSETDTSSEEDTSSETDVSQETDTSSAFSFEGYDIESIFSHGDFEDLPNNRGDGSVNIMGSRRRLIAGGILVIVMVVLVAILVQFLLQAMKRET